jgi:hypothetical protein
MLYILINRTRPNLTGAQYAELASLARGFYDKVPEGVELHGDWAANDGSRTFTLVDADDPALLDRIQAPFRPFVDIETIPVTEVTGWRQG